MSQFKKFNSSDNISNYDSSYRGREGELTWDPSNGLRLHDGNTNGGNPIGGFSGNYYDLYNRPNGSSAVHDLMGGGNSVNNGKILQQTDTTTAEWMSLPITYNTLTANIFTANTKINGGLVNPVGEKVTGLTSNTGNGAPYQQVLLGPNQAFQDFFNRGSGIVGWKIYPENDPSSFVTITQYLNNDLGGPSLGFDTNYLTGTGPWTAESPDYSLGTPGPLTLAANTKQWIFDTTGNLQLPAGGDIVDSSGASVLGGGGASPLQNRFEMKSSNFNAEVGVNYWVDTTDGSVTMTLPASPTLGDWVAFYDGEFKWSTNQPTVSGNGNNIRVVAFGGPNPTWQSSASTVTIGSSNSYGPAGPLPYKFVWTGSVWSGSM